MIHNYKILVVDDELDITSMLKRYLELEDFKVDVCNDPVQALELIKQKNYKILITDLMMPNMSGIELIKEAKLFNGLIQVVVITGYVTSENIILAFKHGANNCIFKPFKNMEMIKQEIEQAINKLERIFQVLNEKLKLQRD
ncbi:MAG: response regulator [Oligoflexia bacterium]|nr:response regulator [Oligoflexia bacterium]